MRLSPAGIARLGAAREWLEVAEEIQREVVAEFGLPEVAASSLCVYVCVTVWSYRVIRRGVNRSTVLAAVACSAVGAGSLAIRSV